MRAPDLNDRVLGHDVAALDLVARCGIVRRAVDGERVLAARVGDLGQAKGG